MEIPQVQFSDKVFTLVVAVCCDDAAVAVFEEVDGRHCDLAATSSGEGDFWRPRRLTAVSRRGLGVALTPGISPRCQTTGVRLHN